MFIYFYIYPYCMSNQNETPLTIKLFERAKGIKAGDKFVAREISVEGHSGIELVRIEEESSYQDDADGIVEAWKADN